MITQLSEALSQYAWIKIGKEIRVDKGDLLEEGKNSNKNGS